MKKLLFLALLACCKPEPTHPVTQVVDAGDYTRDLSTWPDETEGTVDDCSNACKKMWGYGCTTAEKTRDGETCTHLCRRSRELLHPDCVVKSSTRLDLKACHVECRVK